MIIFIQENYLFQMKIDGEDSIDEEIIFDNQDEINISKSNAR